MVLARPVICQYVADRSEPDREPGELVGAGDVRPVEGETDAEAERQQEDVQMERTVSSDATIGFTTNQDNVKQIYHNIVGASNSFLYFENQYFRSLDLADWVVAQGKANPELIAIFVVVDSPEEGNDPVTQHGNHLQHEFFDRIVKALGSQVGIYTMTQRAVHSKFLLTDNRYMTIGAANFVRWDYTTHPGSSSAIIADYLAEADSDRGDAPSGGELVATRDTGNIEDPGTAVA